MKICEFWVKFGFTLSIQRPENFAAQNVRGFEERSTKLFLNETKAVHTFAKVSHYSFLNAENLAKFCTMRNEKKVEKIHFIYIL